MVFKSIGKTNADVLCIYIYIYKKENVDYKHNETRIYILGREI